MEKVINLGIPHVGEQIFESIDTPGLIKCLEVSETWKVLAENVLVKRWKGKMFEACKNGETKVVELLLERCNSEENGLNIKDEKGTTAFMWACINGHKYVVQLFLYHSDRNTDLNAKDNRGYTSFMIACHFGHKDVIKLFLDHFERIDLNARDNDGDTAFTLACHNGQKDVVQLLLENSNIDLKTRENRGDTAFMTACYFGHKDCSWVILKELI